MLPIFGHYGVSTVFVMALYLFGGIKTFSLNLIDIDTLFSLCNFLIHQIGYIRSKSIYWTI